MYFGMGVAYTLQNSTFDGDPNNIEDGDRSLINFQIIPLGLRVSKE